ncbi:MAG TPA: DUF1365 domain-containing protein [Rhodospirillaceae bacterium]|nr:DUF1365 domain-containing protein [Rhodospirillaceae bacterium]
MMRSCLYLGQVMHHRLAPVGHRFTYRVASLLVDLDELNALGSRWLSHNRANLFSIHDRDLGDGADPRRWIDGELARHGIRLDGGRVTVHLFPRVLGFGFTPLTTWFCRDAAGRLAAVLYEVHNTFGERHAYLVHTEADQRRTLRHSADKCFHVSPFIGLGGTYDFAVRAPDEILALSIRERDRATGRPILIATHTARRAPLTDAALLRAALAYPLLPLKILGGIHWEALRLWLKGAPFHRKPPPPEALVSLADKRDVL